MLKDYRIKVVRPELVMTSRKSVARIGFGLLLAVLSSFLILPPQFAGEKVPKKFSKRADATLSTRKKQIQLELESLISNNVDPCQALFEDTSFFSPERVFLFRFLSFSLFSASTTTARL